LAVAVALAGAKAALVVFTVADGFEARALQRIAMEFPGLDQAGLGKRATHAQPLEAAHDEVAFGPFDARFLAHAKARRLAVTPLAGIAGVVGQPHRAEAIQLVGLPNARLAFAIGQVGDAETLPLAVGNLADVARPRIVRQPLGALEIRPSRPRRHDARLAGHRSRGPRGLVGTLEHQTRFGGRSLGPLDDRLRRIWRRWRRRLRLSRRRHGGQLRRRRGRRHRFGPRAGQQSADLRLETPQRQRSHYDNDAPNARARRPPPRSRPRRRRQGGLGAFTAGAAQARRRDTGSVGKALRRRVLDLGQCCAKQRAPCLNALRPVGRREGHRAVNRSQERRREAITLRFGQRPIGILADARGSVGRRLSRDRVIEDSGRGIDVAPRALLAVERILFDRRILRREHAGQAARAAAHRLTRGAEIDEDGNAVAPDDDVRRLDVAMKEALRMHRAEAAQQSIGQAAHVVGWQAAAEVAQELGHVLAVLELHDGIGRAIGFEVTQHRHDMGMTEARQRARLVEEALAAPGEILDQARAARHHRAVAVADRALDRQVFLDGDDLGELRVERAVGDAETAMPDHRIEAVVAEPRAGGKSLNVVEGHGHAQPGPLDARSRADAQASGYYRARYRAAVVAEIGTVLEPGSRKSGTRRMTMIRTQSPIAVSMVTGRVRKTGFGPWARRSSGMSDTPNGFIKESRPSGPKYWAKPCKNHRARSSRGQEKGFYHNELDDRAAILNKSTTGRDLQSAGHLLWDASTFF
jgi:hypothetical protein